MLPGLNLLQGENLHSGANCAHEQRLSLSYNYLAGSLINAMSYKCADSSKVMELFCVYLCVVNLLLFCLFGVVFFCCCIFCLYV